MYWYCYTGSLWWMYWYWYCIIGVDVLVLYRIIVVDVLVMYRILVADVLVLVPDLSGGCTGTSTGS